MQTVLKTLVQWNPRHIELNYMVWGLFAVFARLRNRYVTVKSTVLYRCSYLSLRICNRAMLQYSTWPCPFIGGLIESPQLQSSCNQVPALSLCCLFELYKCFYVYFLGIFFPYQALIIASILVTMAKRATTNKVRRWEKCAYCRK